jgi:hypothetical protein
MLEILLVIYMSRKVGAIAASKGHSKALYITIFVILWIFGELAGGVIGAIAGDGENPLVYLFALGGAACGAVLGFIIVNSLPDCRTEEEALDLDVRRRPLQEPTWNAEYFQPGKQPVNPDSEHIQLDAQAARRAATGGSDSTGIQSR